jgi:EpsI family protein
MIRVTPLRVAAVLLVVRGALLYSSERPEYLPPMVPLGGFPLSVGNWRFLEEGVVDQETRDFLKADDLMDRVYASAVTKRQANLLVAAFRTLSTGVGPHSPKNCLPGSGWSSLLSDELTLQMPSGAITVNRYVVGRGAERALVLYWYQSRGRVVASEYKAKLWSIADAIRLNRTDTALVRVVVPIPDEDQGKATSTAVDFVQAFFEPLRRLLPT